MTEQTAFEFSLSSADNRLQALLKAAERWMCGQSLILPEIEYILRSSRKIYPCRNRLTAEKLSVSLHTSYELFVWARPESAEGDLTGMQAYARWFARWLVVCLSGKEDLQQAVCCAISIRAQSRAQRFVY